VLQKGQGFLGINSFMLSREHNELLTRTGPGTPMGELIRRYWIPAILSEEIPAPDCPPVQVRLLGEELVAFRDTDGRIGLLEEHCSHRGTSLFYGRNEECGLRCIYHGWKYDAEGNVVDTPAEPAGSEFWKKLTHKCYPTREVAGMVFAYLGPQEKMPLFPDYEWTKLPPTHTYVTRLFWSATTCRGSRASAIPRTSPSCTASSPRLAANGLLFWIHPRNMRPKKQILACALLRYGRPDPILSTFGFPASSCRSLAGYLLEIGKITSTFQPMTGMPGAMTWDFLVTAERLRRTPTAARRSDQTIDEFATAATAISKIAKCKR
jgi:nitrite reductase/ring-hydroxylating ferredoxin subunit